MSSSRPKVKLDEQSFQNMLAAAFTIQEHNAKRKRAAQPQPVCGMCGAPVKEGELLCGPCAGTEFRPGEQMQRKWASLWLMNQEPGLLQNQAREERETVAPEIPSERAMDTLAIADHAEEGASPANQEPDHEAIDKRPSATLENLMEELAPDVAPISVEEDEDRPAPLTLGNLNLRNLRLQLHFHRADLYLVVAILVATWALFWVLSATPAPGAGRKPRLRLWERALVSLGLAEAPEPPPRRGNPAIQVWVDPRTALYYCSGEEPYGKTPGGRVTTQGEAQMDQFEPSGRAPCE
jgi:hypothetical protein